MRVLAIDTALGLCSAAMAEDGRLLAVRSEPMQQGHQERLAPLTAEMMAESGLSFGEAERIAVTVGPGSFTGLRVGIAFAKGLGLALDRPVVGVECLHAIAASAERRGRGCAVIDARRGQVYARLFDGNEPAGPPEALTLDDLVAKCGGLAWIAGPGSALLAEHFPDADVDARPGPDPLAVARLGAEADPVTHPAEPIYLRAPDAKLPGGIDP